MENKQILTVKEFREFLGLGENSAYRICHDPGFYPMIRIGRSIRISRPLLDQWIAEQGMKAGGMVGKIST